MDTLFPDMDSQLNTGLTKMAKPDPQMTIPFWPDHVRAIPNHLARSALYRVMDKRKPREMLKDVPVATIGHATIKYRGEELRQDDADVFLQLIHLARNQPLDSPIVFTKARMVSELGWTKNTKSAERLHECLMRSAASLLSITTEEGGFTGRLIDRFEWRNEMTGVEDKVWRIWLDPKILFLFGANTYSWIEWETRIQMGPLAKWLHAYYSTHKDPFDIKVETLMLACGTSRTDINQFARDLKIALNEIQDLDEIADHQVTDKKVRVVMPKRLKL